MSELPTRWPLRCAHLRAGEAPYAAFCVQLPIGQIHEKVGVCIFCAKRLDMMTRAVVTALSSPDIDS